MLIVCCVAGVVSTTTTLVNLNPPERFFVNYFLIPRPPIFNRSPFNIAPNNPKIIIIVIIVFILKVFIIVHSQEYQQVFKW